MKPAPIITYNLEIGADGCRKVVGWDISPAARRWLFSELGIDADSLTPPTYDGTPHAIRKHRF